MRRIVLAIVSLLAVLLASFADKGQATGQPTSPPASLPATSPVQANSASDRVAGWREDLRLLAETLATRHKDAFTITSRERFDEAIRGLDSRLDGLTDQQTFYELKRLVALVGDAHTNLGDSKGRFNTPFCPFSVLILDDGTYVTAATEAQKGLLGLKITRIGAVEIDDAIDRLGALVPHENRAWLLAQVKNLIISPDALAFVGLADDNAHATFTLADAAGKETTVTLSPMQPGERQSPDARLAPMKIAPTLRPRFGNAIYGSMLLSDSRDLYIWFDACRDDKNKTVAQFCKETLDAIERDKPQRIIIDLRRNSGGNSALIQPLVRGLASRNAASNPAPPFVLIGRGTFSSGLWAAEDFKRQAHAILVGGPTGGKPNSFGEQRSVELPHSGLTLYYSTKKWVREPEGDPESLEPDVRSDLTWEDLVEGRDAAIDAVRAFKAE